MGQYKSQHTGPQIDAGINAALNPDVAVTPDSDALVTSGAVADALNNIDPTITSDTDTTLNGILVGNGSKVGTKSLDTSSLTNDGDHVPASSVVKSALTSLENDLASIHATGTTNTTGAAIPAKTYFYLNNVLVRAKADIASGATYTSGTNYETVTAGGLNDLMSALTSSQTTEWKQVTKEMSASAGVAIDLSQYNKIAIEVRQTYISTYYYGSYMLPVQLIATEENRFAFDVVTSWQMGAQYNANTQTLYIYSIQNPPDYSPYWRVLAFN